jgi:hydrophobe/amphiphile efflux-1 (HAE1) family protein
LNLISLSIRRPVFAWVLMSGLIVIGAVCAGKLGISQLPDIDFPTLSIGVTYEGASPEVVESELIEPIEERLLGIEGVVQMKSSVRQGAGSVTLDLDIRRNVDIALQEVQAALSQLRLPADVDPPTIRKTNPEDQPFMFLGVTSTRPADEMFRWIDGFLLDQFRLIPGIGEVSIGGYPERNLRIWPDPEKLKALELTVVDIANALQSQHLESAAGQFVNGRQELRVRWLGEAITPDEVGDILILRRGGEIIHQEPAKRHLRIRDVARVEDGLSDVRRIARINGVDGVGIGVRKQRGENEVELGKAVRKKVEEIKPLLPEGYELRINVDLTRPTKAVVHTTYEKLIFAAVVTILVCFLFLGSWQAALNILFSIPTSIVGTFIVIYFSGFTLNLFSLLALTLAISIVVDDAIMLLENIVRHHRMGKNSAQAAYDGAMEILPAAAAATLAVVAVFLPVIFMDGVIGKFFFQFGVVMSAAVLLSLVEAVTITPMRAAAIMSTESKVNRFEHWLDERFDRLNAAYARLLGATLRFPKLVVIVSILAFALSLVLVKGVRQEFVPLQDQDFIIVNGQCPPGTPLEVTSQKAREIEDILRKHPHVSSIISSIGAGGPAAEVNQFFLPVELVPRQKRPVNHQKLMDEFRQEFKKVEGVRVSMRDFSTRGLTSGRQFPVSFNLVGPDLETLNANAQELIKRLDAEGLTQDLDTDFKLGLPEFLIRPNRAEMARRGVSVDSVAQTLGATVAGLRQGEYTADGKRFDIRVKLADARMTSADDIGGILIRNNYGNLIPLSELVTFEERKTYQSITRVNRQRAVGVFGNLKTGKSQTAVLERARQISIEILPDGYAFSLEGAASGLSESFKSLTGALLMGIVVAYMILAVQFNSFVHPVSVLMALPFSVTGALLSLWITGTSLNLFSFIGLIVLMGIAKKNSILLVEFTNQVREQGIEAAAHRVQAAGQKPATPKYDPAAVREALIKACPVRLRPVLMTSVATIAAATPLIIGNSIGQETRTPMGLPIIGGTIVSTALTLFVVPSLYLVLSRFESRKKVILNQQTLK